MIRIPNNTKLTPESGVAFVEVALTMGLFLALLLGVLWLPLAVNARTSLTISLGEGVRFGVTRGNSGHKFSSPFPEINAGWSGLLEDSSLPSSVRQLLEQNSGITAGDLSIEAARYYTGIIYQSPQADSLAETNVPQSYVYALMAIHEYMRIRVGKNMVRYPCDDKPGCLGCKFLNVMDFDTPGSGGVAIQSPKPFVELASASKPPRADRIAIRCTYNPDFGILSTMAKLFGNTESGTLFQISRSAYVSKATDF